MRMLRYLLFDFGEDSTWGWIYFIFRINAMQFISSLSRRKVKKSEAWHSRHIEGIGTQLISVAFFP